MLIVVDIQKEYHEYISRSFRVEDFAQFLNRKRKDVVVLYNGPSVAITNSTNLKNWYEEHGLKDRQMERIRWIDKGYGFFRDAIDAGIPRKDIVEAVKWMLTYGYWDSTDMDWNLFNGYSDVNIDIPYVLYEFLRGVPDKVEICGGFRDECLAEVLILMDAMGKRYKLVEKFVY